MLADRTLWREGAALDSADYHGLTLALGLQLWLQGGYSLTQSAGIPQWQSEFVLPWIRVLASLSIWRSTDCRC